MRRGDTLSAIAKRFGTSVTALQRSNGLRSANAIRTGQVLVIALRATAARSTVVASNPPPAPAPEPAAGCVHVVRRDTLWTIARRYGSGVDAIRRANSLPHSNRIFPRKLSIPDFAQC